MANGVVYSNKDLRYLSKKHFCPICNLEMNKVKVTKIINSNSEDADENMPKMFSKRIVLGSRGAKFKNYHIAGDVKCITNEFECSSCHRRYTVDQMKQIEASSEEVKKELVALFDEANQASLESSESEICEAQEVDKKKRTKRILLFVIPSIMAVIALFSAIFSMIYNSNKYVDTNGDDNFALCEITMDDILSDKTSYSSMMSSSTHSGYHSDFVGYRYRDYDYDYISKSFGKVNGIIILQATKTYKDTLILKFESDIKSGNAEIVILVDGEYYKSVELNKKQSVTLKNISGKEVIVKLAAESAKIEVSVERTYKESASEDSLNEYEAKLYEALSKYYENAKVVRYCYVTKDSQIIEQFCIIDSGSGLDVISIVSTGGGKKTDVIILEKNIVVDKSYYVKSQVNDYYIGFKLFNKQLPSGDFYNIADFKYNGTKYWFVIDYIDEFMHV